jgi:hypothetical protein
MPRPFSHPFIIVVVVVGTHRYVSPMHCIASMSFFMSVSHVAFVHMTRITYPRRLSYNTFSLSREFDQR